MDYYDDLEINQPKGHFLVMTTHTLTSQAAPSGYRSGTAARLTGIPVETLRVWERRYSVVGPRMSERGQRLYSSDDIQRLTLIKQLVDAGYPIGSVARLPTATLQDMRTPSEPPSRSFKVGVAGTFMASPTVIDALKSGPLEVVCHSMMPQQAADIFEDAHVDAVIVELPTLTEATAALITNIQKSCDARQAIVLYRFAPGKVIRRLRQSGFKVARASSDPREIATLCQTLLQSPVNPDIATRLPVNNETPPRQRYNDEQLSAFLSSANNPYCECPRHLVELILSLNSFEAYSAECVTRSPEDAGLHRDLQRTAGHARALLENALERVAEVEGWH